MYSPLSLKKVAVTTDMSRKYKNPVMLRYLKRIYRNHKNNHSMQQPRYLKWHDKMAWNSIIPELLKYMYACFPASKRKDKSNDEKHTLSLRIDKTRQIKENVTKKDLKVLKKSSLLIFICYHHHKSRSVICISILIVITNQSQPPLLTSSSSSIIITTNNLDQSFKIDKCHHLFPQKHH